MSKKTNFTIRKGLLISKEMDSIIKFNGINFSKFIRKKFEEAIVSGELKTNSLSENLI